MMFPSPWPLRQQQQLISELHKAPEPSLGFFTRLPSLGLLNLNPQVLAGHLGKVLGCEFPGAPPPPNLLVSPILPH